MPSGILVAQAESRVETGIFRFRNEKAMEKQRNKESNGKQGKTCYLKNKNDSSKDSGGK